MVLLRKIKLIPAITRLTSHFTCGLMSDFVNCKHTIECGHTWLWMSLLRAGVIKQQIRLKLILYLSIVWCYSCRWAPILVSSSPTSHQDPPVLMNYLSTSVPCSVKSSLLPPDLALVLKSKCAALQFKSPATLALRLKLVAELAKDQL